MTKKKSKVMKSITLSPILAEFVESKSEKIGITQSDLIAIALSHYMRKVKAIEAINTNQETIQLAKYLLQIRNFSGASNFDDTTT